MKKLLALLIALMTVLLCSCSSGGETIRFGAAGTGGIYNEAANSIKSIADAEGSRFCGKCSLAFTELS